MEHENDDGSEFTTAELDAGVQYGRSVGRVAMELADFLSDWGGDRRFNFSPVAAKCLLLIAQDTQAQCGAFPRSVMVELQRITALLEINAELRARATKTDVRGERPVFVIPNSGRTE